MTQSYKRPNKFQTPSVQSWKTTIYDYEKKIRQNSSVHCGWGNVVFANTFSSQREVISELEKEGKSERDLAFYVKDPHVLTSISPTDIFLDPSHTFRIWFENYVPPKRLAKNIVIRRVRSLQDINAINTLLMSRGMVPLNSKKVGASKSSQSVIFVLAENEKTKEVVGFVNGINHEQVFHDPEKGSSLWSLAVDPQTNISGVGEALVRYLIEHFMAKGCSYMDLSVIHENHQAIKLYQKLHFERVPVYTVKLRNKINEKLYTPSKHQTHLNPYGQIIVDEAVRRGINVKILDKESCMFSLTWGGRTVSCRESLTEFTSAIAMTRCADKRLTARVLERCGLQIPEQLSYKDNMDEVLAFQKKFKRVVVKPAHGEQGTGVKLNLTSATQVKKAIKELCAYSSDVVIENMVEGLDIRTIVINYQFVAAAHRRPPEIMGDGQSSIEVLIKKLSRRRQAATQGESKVVVNDEVIRTLQSQGLKLSDVLAEGRTIKIHNIANLHMGGTISDITNELPDYFRKISEKAAKALEIPVVGLDFMIPKLDQKKYWILEANERPGLANHEPAPTAEKFVDFLFPQSIREINYD